jgi:hypothetical protein
MLKRGGGRFAEGRKKNKRLTTEFTEGAETEKHERRDLGAWLTSR